MNYKVSYSKFFIDAIEKCADPSHDQILVIVGDCRAIDLSRFKDLIVDQDTFTVSDGSFFNKAWFKGIFDKLSKTESCSIISYVQYSYLTKYILSDFFSDRTLFLFDNLRNLYPLLPEEFIADTQEMDDVQKELPVYQADQFLIEGNYYYSFILPDINTNNIEFVFEKRKKLELSTNSYAEDFFIDISSDERGIDLLLNKLINGDSLSNNWKVSFNKKYPNIDKWKKRLEQINYFLATSGGSLSYTPCDQYEEVFYPTKQLDSLLKKYWGPSSEFRNLKVYKNPHLGSNETREISQGQIVQTVINEYHNAKNSQSFRDIFITAPTGAGKSLLFQLPAFHISDCGDVTIVISPLIALMKDQVSAINNDRGFFKIAYINSEVSLVDRENIIRSCKDGEIDILYMAPELLLSYDYTYFVGNKREIGLVVIDEAHLVTTWGRDFRVDYWYVGTHINKIRKYSGQGFPIVALTATAVYGGDKNDMVFDTTDSLYLRNPHYFIGNVKRDNIDFIIGNYKSTSKNLDKEKFDQTINFIEYLDKRGFKSLIYAPFTSQVKKISQFANKDKEIVVTYYGKDLDPFTKEQMETAFRYNKKRIMVCTKAFGMGIDIPDIQVIYHHAPSGLLPDYIQEIGRAARKSNLKGYAVVNYNEKDLTYSKQLYGMSSLKLYQIKAVLKKVYETYINNGNKRNMLLSVDDFSYIFSDDQNPEVKIKTALMMIEKDYILKYRYNVLLARPKSLFTRVYASCSSKDYSAFQDKYPGLSTYLHSSPKGEESIFMLDLGDLWARYFPKESFPVLKKRFYNKKLFESIDVTPRIQFKFKLSNQCGDISIVLSKVLNILKSFFVETKDSFFDKDDMKAAIKRSGFDESTSKQLVSFVLSSYSSLKNIYGHLEGDAFLQKRNMGQRQYRVMSTKYEANFTQLIRIANKLFNDNIKSTSRFVRKENSLPYYRIGSFMEIMNIGSYEMLGGEAPMIFVRLNYPKRIEIDCRNKSYTNVLFTSTQEKHAVSNDLFQYFFTRDLSNEDRWNFIEDFFLGENNEELFKKYPADSIVESNILNVIDSKEVDEIKEGEIIEKNQGLIYPPIKSVHYKKKDHLSLMVDGVYKTHSIGEWIDENPIALHRCIQKKEIYVDLGNVYKALMNRLRIHYCDYYKKIIGLNKMISFPGYKEPIMAKSAMMNDPIKFYKWYKKAQNKDLLYVPMHDLYRLFTMVLEKEPQVLNKKDYNLLLTWKKMSLIKKVEQSKEN